MSTTTRTRDAIVTQDQRATTTEVRDDGPPRDLLMAHRGMVAAANHFAAQAGVEILRRGGNAVDAAIAAAAVMTTVEPWNGHLGGDTFMLISRPDREGGNEVIALNGSGAAPLAATAADYRAAGGFPEKGLRTSTVPGTPSAWAYAAERFGTLPLGELLEAGAWYAEHGVPVTASLHASLKKQAPVYAKNPDAAAVFLPNGEIPPVGGILRQPGLARSLNRIADGGRDAFYGGDLATQMVAASTTYGGLFALEDFANHKTDEIAPLAIDYRGYTVYEQPPVSQGIIVLLALNILENVDLASFGQGSAQHIHYMVEALKLAVADKDRYIGDPAFVEMPLEKLLSKEHAAEQAAKIDPRARHARFPAPAAPAGHHLPLRRRRLRHDRLLHPQPLHRLRRHPGRDGCPDEQPSPRLQSGRRPPQLPRPRQAPGPHPQPLAGPKGRPARLRRRYARRPVAGPDESADPDQPARLRPGRPARPGNAALHHRPPARRRRPAPSPWNPAPTPTSSPNSSPTATRSPSAPPGPPAPPSSSSPATPKPASSRAPPKSAAPAAPSPGTSGRQFRTGRRPIAQPAADPRPAAGRSALLQPDRSEVASEGCQHGHLAPSGCGARCCRDQPRRGHPAG